MSRPKKQRVVNQPPVHRSFKPVGVPRTKLELLNLSLDEFEAIRLADHLGMDHNDASGEMEISRSTFTRLIEKAHKKISRFLIIGGQLNIDGGNIHFRTNILSCGDCDHKFNINFETHLSSCPKCGSKNLFDLAGGFGHGKCCHEKIKGENK